MTVLKFGSELNPIDANCFFIGECRDANVGMTAVAVLANELTYDEVMRAATRIVDYVPRLRQRLKRACGGQVAPSWVDDPNFELARHVENIHVGENASISDLFAVVDDIQGAGFPGHRPPHRLGYVTGLAGGRSALILCVHHSMLDGITLVRLMYAALGRESGSSPAQSALPAIENTPVSAAKTVRATVALAAREFLRQGRRFVRHSHARAQLADDIATVVASRRQLGRSDSRRNALTAIVSLDRWRTEAHRRGAGVNELLIALVADTWKRYRSAVGADPQKCRLLIPVDLRRQDQHVQDAGNTIAGARLELDGVTNYLADLAPLRRLVRSAIQHARDNEGSLLEPAMLLLPGSIRAQVALRLNSWAEVAASNLIFEGELVVGHAIAEQLFILGPPIGAAIATVLTTYRDNIHLTLNCDVGRVTNPPALAGSLRACLAEADLIEPGGPARAVEPNSLGHVTRSTPAEDQTR